MDEKKVIKISLSTVFLIIAIIAICVMGYFLYVSNSKTANMKLNEKELNDKVAKLEDEIAKLEDEIASKQVQIKNEQNNKVNNSSVTFSSLSGVYAGDIKIEPGMSQDEETEVRLYLYENGSFKYDDHPGLASCKIGYYTFDENNIILHEVLLGANDIGRTITSDTITLKINSDKSITDSKLNVVLKKTSQKIENTTDIISSELKSALDNKVLY